MSNFTVKISSIQVEAQETVEPAGLATIWLVEEPGQPRQTKAPEKLTFKIESSWGRAWLDTCRDSLRRNVAIHIYCGDKDDKIRWVIEGLNR